jgi:DNA helicase II / ATP-dependent DNA helicase PcrA
VAYLRLIQNPASDIDLLRVINVPARGIGATTQERLTELARTLNLPLHEVLSEAYLTELRRAEREKVLKFRALLTELRKDCAPLPADAVVELMLQRTGYQEELHRSADLIDQGRLENLRELITAARDFGEIYGDQTLQGFLEHVALVTSTDLAKGGRDRVSLMTLHAAKGLEFDWVFMVGMEEGLLPHYRVLNPDEEDLGSTGDLEEERRLCYVGMTRARKQLWLSHVLTRSLFGRTQANPPSRFLEEIGPLAESSAPALAPHADATFGPDIELDEHDGIVVDYSDEYSQSAPRLHRPIPGRGAGSSAGHAGWVGQEVSHAAFGRGRVLKAEPSGQGYKLIIQFEDVGKKTVLSKFVKPL